MALAGEVNAQETVPPFDPPVVFATFQSFPWGLASGDIDGDGFPEVAVACAEVNLADVNAEHTGSVGIVRVWNNLNLWGTNPSNSLIVRQDVVVDVNASPAEVVLVDIDNDDDLDMIVTSGYAPLDGGDVSTRGVYVIPFDGPTNTFDDSFGNGGKEYYGSAGVRSLAIADFDNDGLPDIVVGTDLWELDNPAPVVYFFENVTDDPNAPKRFARHGPFGTGHTGDVVSSGVAVGDFNRLTIGAPRIDVVAGNPSFDDVSVLANSPTGNFSFTPSIETGCGDGNDWAFRQLASSNLESGSKNWDVAAIPDMDQRLFVLHGDKHGNFMFDCDGMGGFDDIYPACYQCDDLSPFNLNLAGDVAIGQLNGGTKPDIVVSVPSETDPRVILYLGNGDGTFQVDTFQLQYCPLTRLGSDGEEWPFNVLLVDLNQDGFDDIITSNHGDNPGQGSISVLINQMESTPSP